MLNLRFVHLRFHVRKRCRKLSLLARPAVAATAQETSSSEYTESPEYPKIDDLSFKKRRDRKVENWYNSIRTTRTVEEKMVKINMPRYWGYKVTALGDGKYPYNCLPATQHYTRTIFEDLQPDVPAHSSETEKQKNEALVDSVKGELKDGLEFAHDFLTLKYANEDLSPMERERSFTQVVVEQMHRTLRNGLMADFPHLHEAEVDYNPRHEAFWFVGGIKPPKNVVKSKEGHEWQKDMAKEPIDRLMQYRDVPYLAMRHRHQLPTWQSANENVSVVDELPIYEYDPRTLGYSCDYRHGTNIPGYWPGSESGFGCLSYQCRAHMLIRPESYGIQDFKEALHAQAIQSSFAWLLAQANYNGFNTVSELTYPMNTQTIITNGREWSFYEYQLNTLLMHGEQVWENNRVNFCRGTDELRLYDGFDEHGKVVGFNDQVLRYLVKFYTNQPNVERTQEELQPFLHEHHKRIADYADEEQRTFLERIFKHMSANRQRHLDRPEIYLWEKIYKIDNSTRQMEPRRRFFELEINPWKRTMDQHQKVYIPRALRPEGPKSKKKWKPTFYP